VAGGEVIPRKKRLTGCARGGKEVDEVEVTRKIFSCGRKLRRKTTSVEKSRGKISFGVVSRSKGILKVREFP